MITTKDKRVKERGAWQELQVIIKRYRALGFDYVVKRLPPSKLCFGTTLKRNVVPITEINAMSPLMIRFQPKPTISPTVSKIGRKSASATSTIGSIGIHTKGLKKEGYGPLTSKVPRFICRNQRYTDRMFNPFDYIKPVKKSWQPFGKSMKEKRVMSTVPGPGTYTIKNRARKYIFRDSFGGKKFVISAVQTICSPQNYAICNGCDKEPFGDYWLQTNREKKVYCRSCMKIEHDKAVDPINSKPIRQRKLAELILFQRVRHCGYYHEHQNTRASVKLLTENDLKRKFRRENYLSIFNM